MADKECWAQENLRVAVILFFDDKKARKQSFKKLGFNTLVEGLSYDGKQLGLLSRLLLQLYGHRVRLAGTPYLGKPIVTFTQKLAQINQIFAKLTRTPLLFTRPATQPTPSVPPKHPDKSQQDQPAQGPSGEDSDPSLSAVEDYEKHPYYRRVKRHSDALNAGLRVSLLSTLSLCLSITHGKYDCIYIYTYVYVCMYLYVPYV